MPPELRRHPDTSPIRVSGLGQWVYCNLAWKLNQLGAEPTTESLARTAAGRAWHEEHGETVARADAARRVRALCIVLALQAGAAAAVLWILR